jgi:hypothetical protein
MHMSCPVAIFFWHLDPLLHTHKPRMTINPTSQSTVLFNSRRKPYPLCLAIIFAPMRSFAFCFFPLSLSFLFNYCVFCTSAYVSWPQREARRLDPVIPRAHLGNFECNQRLTVLLLCHFDLHRCMF